MNTSSLDCFFARIARRCEPLLPGPDDPPRPAHWILVARGGAIDVDDAPHADGHHSDLVDALVASGGADAAAHVAYFHEGDERLLTYAVIANPLDSDVRAARITRPEASHGTPVLAGWEPAL